MPRTIAVVLGLLVVCIGPWVAWETKNAADAERVNNFVQGIEKRPVRRYLGNPYAVPKVLIVEKIGDRFEALSGLDGDIWASKAEDPAIQMVAILQCRRDRGPDYCCPQTATYQNSCSADLWDIADGKTRINVSLRSPIPNGEPPHSIKDTGERIRTFGTESEAKDGKAANILFLKPLSRTEIEQGVARADAAMKRAGQIYDFFETLRSGGNRDSYSGRLRAGVSCSETGRVLGQADKETPDGKSKTLTYWVPQVDDSATRLIQADFECKESIVRATVLYVSGNSQSLSSP
jgi:hypothetical protein